MKQLHQQVWSKSGAVHWRGSAPLRPERLSGQNRSSWVTMETGRASARQIQPKICELCGGRQRCLGIQMTNSLLAFFLAGNFVHFKTGTFLCVFVMSKLIFIRWHFSANSLQIWKWAYSTMWYGENMYCTNCSASMLCFSSALIYPPWVESIWREPEFFVSAPWNQSQTNKHTLHCPSSVSVR